MPHEQVCSLENPNCLKETLDNFADLDCRLETLSAEKILNLLKAPKIKPKKGNLKSIPKFDLDSFLDDDDILIQFPVPPTNGSQTNCSVNLRSRIMKKESEKSEKFQTGVSEFEICEKIDFTHTFFDLNAIKLENNAENQMLITKRNENKQILF